MAVVPGSCVEMTTTSLVACAGGLAIDFVRAARPSASVCQESSAEGRRPSTSPPTSQRKLHEDRDAIAHDVHLEFLVLVLDELEEVVGTADALLLDLGDDIARQQIRPIARMCLA